MTPATDDDVVIRTRVLLPALVLLAVLALVPFGAVRELHARRLAAADEILRTIAAQLRPSDWPESGILAGPGLSPASLDPAWASSTTSPLSTYLPSIGHDPWGNAYTVNIGAWSRGGVVWALSAGPNGIIETPFFQTLPAATARGDDRAQMLLVSGPTGLSATGQPLLDEGLPTPLLESPDARGVQSKWAPASVRQPAHQAAIQTQTSPAEAQRCGTAPLRGGQQREICQELGAERFEIAPHGFEIIGLRRRVRSSINSEEQRRQLQGRQRRTERDQLIR